MTDAFNPYRAWLGIVSVSPTHYELLGLTASRCDAESVAEGFRRQMSRLNPHLSGENAAAAQRIASELANARVVLLTPTTRRAYDADLARTQAETADDLLPPSVGPVAATAAASAPPPNQPPPPTLTPSAYSAAPVAAAFAQPVAYGQAAPGYAYGQPYPPQGYPAQPAYLAQQTYAGQQVFPGQQALPQAVFAGQAAPVAAYPSAAPQPETPAPAVSTGASARSVSRVAGSKRSSAAPMLVGMLVAGLAVAGGVMYLVKADGEQVAAGDGSQSRSNGSETRPDKPSAKPTGGRERPKVKPLKIAPVESTSSEEKLFKDEPDSMPADPAETPENDRPKPDASTSPKPEMPKPEMPKLEMPKLEAKTPPAVSTGEPSAASPEEKAAVGEALAAARKALADRNLTEAEDQLAQATLEATAPELLAEVDRVQLLARYTSDFWDAVRQHMAKLGAAETITVDDEEVSIIEASEEKIIVRVAGKRREYAFEKLPHKLAYWLADTWLDKSNPAAFVTLGAYHAVDAKGDRQQARQLFEQAGAAGFDVRLLMAELDAEDEGK